MGDDRVSPGDTKKLRITESRIEKLLEQNITPPERVYTLNGQINNLGLPHSTLSKYFKITSQILRERRVREKAIASAWNMIVHINSSLTRRNATLETVKLREPVRKYMEEITGLTDCEER